MSAPEVGIDLTAVLEHSVAAARLAGKILMENYGHIKPEEIEDKTAFDFVTRVDRASEKAISDYLMQHFPDTAVHAEESGKNRSESDYLWLIDPLDGTKNYVHAFPVFCVSIGFAYRNEVQVGVIYAPSTGELFTAIRGEGAFLNGEPIRVSATREMRHCMIATGFPHAAKQYLDIYLQTFRKIFLRVSAVRRAGSAALDLAYTACGRFDGFWEFKLNPWDLGAGIVILQEAGGVITDLIGGDRYFETGDIVAANPVIHAEMIRILQPICQNQLDW